MRHGLGLIGQFAIISLSLGACFTTRHAGKSSSKISASPKSEDAHLKGEAPSLAAIQMQLKSSNPRISQILRTVITGGNLEVLQQTDEPLTGEELVLVINGLRSYYGLEPVAYSRKLSIASKRHANYIVVNYLSGNFSGDWHDEHKGRPGFRGVSPTERARAAGFKGLAGEGIAPSVENLEQGLYALLKAPVHRSMFLRNNLVDIGFYLTSAQVFPHPSMNLHLPESEGKDAIGPTTVAVFTGGFDKNKDSFPTWLIYPRDGTVIYDFHYHIFEEPRPFAVSGAINGLPITVLYQGSPIDRNSMSLMDLTAKQKIPVISDALRKPNEAHFLNTYPLQGQHHYQIQITTKDGTTLTSEFHTVEQDFSNYPPPNIRESNRWSY